MLSKKNGRQFAKVCRASASLVMVLTVLQRRAPQRHSGDALSIPRRRSAKEPCDEMTFRDDFSRICSITKFDDTGSAMALQELHDGAPRKFSKRRFAILFRDDTSQRCSTNDIVQEGASRSGSVVTATSRWLFVKGLQEHVSMPLRDDASRICSIKMFTVALQEDTSSHFAMAQTHAKVNP